MNFRANMASLRTLSDDHYHNRISYQQYREQRTELLKLIDDDLNGIQISDEQIEVEDDSIINKALSFLKIDKLKETN